MRVYTCLVNRQRFLKEVDVTDFHFLSSGALLIVILFRAMYLFQVHASDMIKEWDERIDYCVPIIAASKDIYNVRTDSLPEMTHGPGYSIHGDKVSDDHDTWVVRV